ncbi:hypothetical protein BU23DRAFT_458552 [Bimuria novae-zelandiae CBS 107.79]|uniref:Uncharacterized protein n=1 Tax=Bimuria novae-zelandiae CBS 107.79 TaxID=1447943 RepID=A0A6A5VFH9_9PLEO|nr:hypothetical protein BU23DRAFT_458552 [Bimuria novae-zelandiae CBS 107.79]
MDTRILLRHLLRNPHTSRTLLTPTTRPHSRTFAQLSLPHGARHISLPTILRPSFWREMIPRPFRERASQPGAPRKEWNPATPYIVLALLVGSQAIQILWLKQERDVERRRAEARIGALREVVERVKSGEKVDVEGLLGVGKEGVEGEWAGLIKEIEEEELLFQSSEEKKKLKAAREEEAVRIEGPNEAVEEKKGDAQRTQEESRVKVEELSGAKFY